MQSGARLGFAAMALVSIAAGDPDILSVAPSKQMSPPEVVRLQLLALGQNRALGDDRGIAVTWRFASPANKAMTGPLERFRSMLKIGYPAMLDHRRVQLGDIDMTAVEARQLVLVEAADGRVHAYMWILGLQEDGANRGCWMTDAVIELDTSTGGPKRASPDRERV